MTITNLLLAGKATAAEQALAEGVMAALSLNPDGRLRVASKPGYFLPVEGDLVGAASTLFVDVTDASNIVMHVKNTGTATMAAGTFVFEGSIDSTNGTDGTWFGIQAVRTNANTPEVQATNLGIVAGAGTTYAWEASVNAVRWMRIRTSVTVTASSIAHWTLIRGTYATEPIPAIQTHAVTQSGNFLVAPATGSAYFLNSAASTNAAVVKSTPGSLTELSIFNSSISNIYLKLYNKTTTPVPATDVPIATLYIPAGTHLCQDFGLLGKRFTAGIGISMGTGTPSDNTAVAAGITVSATYL